VAVGIDVVLADSGEAVVCRYENVRVGSHLGIAVDALSSDLFSSYCRHFLGPAFEVGPLMPGTSLLRLSP